MDVDGLILSAGLFWNSGNFSWCHNDFSINFLTKKSSSERRHPPAKILIEETNSGC
jgi:hypothetical protein